MFHLCIHRLDVFSIQAATMFSGLTKTRIFIVLLCITAVGLFCSSWNLSVYFFSHQRSSVCSCHKCLTEGDPWFSELMSSSPEPFLSRRNTTSEDVFTWWKVNVNLSIRAVQIFSFCFTVIVWRLCVTALQQNQQLPLEVWSSCH